MHRQALLVELGPLDRARRALDAEADEARGGDGLGAEGAGVDGSLRSLTPLPLPAQSPLPAGERGK